MSGSYIAEATGTINGSNTDFKTQHVYYAGTVRAYLNGILIRSTDDNGPIELGNDDVQMKVAPVSGDTLHFWYRVTPVPGTSLPSPPVNLETILLEPDTSAVVLVPDIITATDESPETYAPTTFGHHLLPRMRPKDLKPRVMKVTGVTGTFYGDRAYGTFYYGES